MMFVKENLQILVLKCPYVNWENRETREYFTKMVSLKFRGYTKKHHIGVMPVDTTDFICDHILICDNSENNLTPILGVKTLDYRRCGLFHADFTIEANLKRCGYKEHLNALYSILNQCKETEQNISYYSSYTRLPEISKDRPLASFLKRLFAGLTVLYHTQENISQLLGLGVPKYRTDEFFQTWGFERVSYQGIPLKNIPFFILGGIDGVFIHLKQYTPYALECAEECMGLWKARVTLGSNPIFPEKIYDRGVKIRELQG